MSLPAIDILGLTSQQFIRQAEFIGMRQGAAMDVYRRVFREGSMDPACDFALLTTHPIVNTHEEHGTMKFVLRHEDGLETESVILPIRGSTGRTRHTLCVSSQVGCAMGCKFCETAQMGLMKDLTASQIVGQWHTARFRMDAPIDNIVFMGMGEPMDNIENVIQALRVLCDRNGASLAPAKMSVSTVGRAEGIRRLAEFVREPGFHKLRLAVSINAPNDEVRSRLMPINRSTPMAALMEAMLAWPRQQRPMLIEYVLIPGVNDAIAQADELCDYLRPLSCTVNVIPYNPRRHSPWPAPDDESIRNFVQRIHDNGQFVKRRQTMGRTVMAACGQLGNPTIRGRRLVTS